MSSAIFSALAAPAIKSANVTPNNDADLSFVTRAIYVGGAGNVAVLLQDDSSAVSFVAVPAGTVLPIRAKRIRATGTTATNIVALG